MFNIHNIFFIYFARKKSQSIWKFEEKVEKIILTKVQVGITSLL